MPYQKRLSPSFDQASADLPAVRPSLFDNKDDFIERVSPIGMAAIYFGSFTLVPQDAALSRQALFKLSFAHRYFLQPDGLKISVNREKATLSGRMKSPHLRQLGDILARQIQGIAEVEDEIETSGATTPVSVLREATQLLFATDQTLRSGIDVETDENRIVLNGEVTSAAQKSWAELLVAAVGGDLDSRLQIGLADHKETRVTEVDDESLEALILFRLRLVRETEHLPVRVKASRGVVTMQGKVRSETLRQRAENIARSTVGLRELRSTLAIAA